MSTADAAAASHSVDWSRDLSVWQRFRSPPLEREFQKFYGKKVTIGSSRYIFGVTVILWTAFIASDFAGVTAAPIYRYVLYAGRLSVLVIMGPIIFSSFCWKKTFDMKVAYVTYPGCILIGIQLVLEEFWLRNTESYEGVPLPAMVIIFYAVIMARLTIQQTLMFCIGTGSAYYAANLYVYPAFPPSVPVAFALAATWLASVVVAMDANKRDRHLFWLHKRLQLGMSDVDSGNPRKVLQFVANYKPPVDNMSRNDSIIMSLVGLREPQQAQAIAVSTTPKDTAPAAANPRPIGRTLAFTDRALEQRFDAFYQLEHHGNLRATMAIMFVGELLFSISDYFTLPNNLGLLLGIRLGGTAPLFLVAAITCETRWVRQRLRVLYPCVVALVGLTKFGTVLAVPMGLPTYTIRSFTGAVVRFNFHAVGSFKLRYVHVLVSVVPWCVATAAYMYVYGSAITDLGILLVSCPFALIMSYFVEQQTRSMFLLSELANTTLSASIETTPDP